MGRFGQSVVLNRAEFSALISGFWEWNRARDALREQTVFQDVALSHWAPGYIHAAAGLGIINGYGDGMFGPEDEITLEQACKMVLECMGVRDSGR